jgi:hypothetical protein
MAIDRSPEAVKKRALLRAEARKGKTKTQAPGVPAAGAQSPADAAAAKAIQGVFGQGTASAATALTDRFFDPNNVGKVAVTPQDQRYQADVINRLQAGLGGYTSPEYQAQREAMQRGVESNTQTSLQQLAKAQARGKVYGAAGAAQQANVLESAQRQKDINEQNLMIQNIDEQQKRLGAYAGQTDLARKENMDIQKTNIGEADANRAGQVSMFTGLLGTGLAEKGNRRMSKIYERALAQMR